MDCGGKRGRAAREESAMSNRHWPLAVVFVLGALNAAAQDTNCLGNIGDSTIRGNLLIAASCRLEGTLVIGRVTLFEGGSLTARDARILGNVEGKRGNFVDIDESLIDGDLKIEEFVG